MSERLACKAVGLARSTHRRLPQAQTPADPDVDVRAWLRAYATKHPCHGFRRAWAALRHDEGRAINVKKVHRLWCEEGLQRRVHSPRKRAGTSSVPEVIADAPKVVWALDFQFDSTIDGKAIKIGRWSTNTLVNRCFIWWNAPSPPSDSSPSSRRCSPRPAAHRRCCGWTTDQS
jgi:putative transposase